MPINGTGAATRDDEKTTVMRLQARKTHDAHAILTQRSLHKERAVADSSFADILNVGAPCFNKTKRDYGKSVQNEFSFTESELVMQAFLHYFVRMCSRCDFASKLESRYATLSQFVFMMRMKIKQPPGLSSAHEKSVLVEHICVITLQPFSSPTGSNLKKKPSRT